MSTLNVIKPKYVQNIIDKFCVTIGMLPTSYKSAMTYEEQIYAIGLYLEETVYPAINENAKALAELQNLYLELKNYFDNLNVQEEINNKLDEMAESGELEEIISNFLELNSLIIFDSVQEMKESDNLIVGSTVKTLGFYNSTDCGGAFYKITENVEPDEITTFALNNNLFAQIILQHSMNVKQFGAKGDNIADDTLFIQKCIDLVNNIEFPNGIYMIKAHDENQLIGASNHNSPLFLGGLILRSNIALNGTNATLKVIPNNSQNYNILRAYNVSNIVISNINFVGDTDSHLTEAR